MIKFSKILVLTLFFVQSGFAISKIDSLKTLLTTTENDTVYIQTLNILSKELRWSDQVSAMDYAVKAEKTAEKLDYKIGLALAFHNIGAIYADKRNNELALEYYNKSLKLEQDLNRKEDIANTAGNIGLIYRRLRDFDRAIEYHNKSLKIKQELNDSIGIAYSYGNIGIIYTQKGKYDKALIHFYRSLRIKESLNDKYGMANSYGNIGIIYLEINSIDQAKVSLERSLRLFKEINNKSGIAMVSLNLGEIYYQQGIAKKAIEAYKTSLDIYIEMGNIKGIADAYLKLGTQHYNTRQDSLACMDFLKSLEYYTKITHVEGVINSRIAIAKYYQNYKNYEKAQHHLRIAIKLASEGRFLALENDALRILADILLDQEQYIEASELLVKVRALTDTLYNEKLIQEVTQIRMQHNFDNQLKEKEYQEKANQLLQQLQLRRMKYTRNVSIIAFILIFIIVVILYINGRIIGKKNKLLEKQKQRIANQVEMLNNQKQKLIQVNKTKDKFMSIIGHDLRNPFNAINSFVSLVTEQLIDFDREVFEKYLLLIKEAGSNAQSLLENLMEWAQNQSEEIKLQREDVPLNSIVKGNILLIKESAKQKGIEIEEHLDGQPIVQIDKNMINTVIRNILSNALKFTPNMGSISMRTEVGNNEVKVLIEDSGIGITQDKLDLLLGKGVYNDEDTGLANSGLGILLCKEFLLKHNQKLSATSDVGEGTRFWFHLPLKHKV